MMKTFLFAAIALFGLAAVLSISSCSGDEVVDNPNGSPRLSGVPVTFTAGSDKTAKKSYLDFSKPIVEQGPTGTVMKIVPFWNAGDELRINSAAADGTSPQAGAIYMAATGEVTATALTYSTGGQKIQWLNGSDAGVTQEFYSIFPEENSTLVGSLAQSTVYVDQDGSINSKSAGYVNTNFVAVGKQVVAIPAGQQGASKKVTLDYKLIPTVIHLTLNTDGQQIRSILFEDAREASAKSTAGIWQLDLKTEVSNGADELTVDATPKVFLTGNVRVSLPGAPVSGELEVEAYLLPHEYPAGVKITVQQQDGSKIKEYSKTTGPIKAHAVHQVKFGKVGALAYNPKYDIFTIPYFQGQTIDFKMIKIEKGSFKYRQPVGGYVQVPGIGSLQDEGIGATYQVLTTLTKDFAIGETEVTQELWEALMEQPWYMTYSGYATEPNNGKGRTYPAYYISWNRIVGTPNDGSNDNSHISNPVTNYAYTVNGVNYFKNGFMYRLSKLVNNNTDFTASTSNVIKFHLPTEAQWEYAAKGVPGDYLATNAPPFVFAGSNNIAEVAWFHSSYDVEAGRLLGSAGTCPVGTKKPNQIGLYDMTGNVDEMCSDGYPGSWPTTTQTDPTGDTSSDNCKLRGGNRDRDANKCRIACKASYSSLHAASNYYQGFRLAYTITP